MTAFFTALGRFVVRFRWPILVIWLFATIGAVAAFPSLGSQVNNNNSAFLPSGSPSLEAQNLLKPIQGNDNFTNQVFIVALHNGGQLTTQDENAITSIQATAARIDNVAQVVQTAISPDGQATELTVKVAIDNFAPTQATQLINDLTRVVRQAAIPRGLQVNVAGPLATEVANNNQSRTTAGSLQGLSVIFIIVLLLVIFRSALAPLVTLFPAVLVLALAGSLIGELGSQGLKVSEFTQLLMIVLVLGAGTDYGLFLVFRVREELWAGREPKDAVAVALARVGESITASAGTVIFALITLLLASFGIYRDLGIPLAIAIAVMLAAGLTFLPALLSVMGKAVFWPSKIRVGDARHTIWGKVAARLVRKPAITLVIGVLFFGLLAGAVGGFKSGGFGGAVTPPKHSDAAAGDQAMTSHFPHSSAQPTILVLKFASPVWRDPNILQIAQTEMQQSPLFTGVQGPLDPTGESITPSQLAVLHSQLGPAKLLPAVDASTTLAISKPVYNLYRATAQFISADGRTIAYEVGLKAGDPGSNAAMAQVPAMRKLISQIARSTGAADSGVAGEAPGLYDVDTTSASDMTHIIPISALAIALLLALVLRSLVAPLYLILSVVLSYLAALGMSVLIFIDWRGDTGLTFLLPFLMFIFLLALGEDYNILVMTRIREEVHDLPLRQAVVRAVGATGPTITSAGIVLAGSFAILGLSAGNGPQSSQIQAIGFGLAVGILMDTFLVRTVLVPAMVSILGRWNWWPSHLSQEIGPEDLEESDPGGAVHSSDSVGSNS